MYHNIITVQRMCRQDTKAVYKTALEGALKILFWTFLHLWKMKRFMLPAERNQRQWMRGD